MMCDYFDFETDIGAIIRQVRKSQRMSLKEVAQEIGVSEQAMSQYELGKRKVSYELADKIFSCLGTSVLEQMHENELYDEYVPPFFKGDVIAYEAFKKAVDKDVEEDLKQETVVKGLFEFYGFKYEFVDGATKITDNTGKVTTLDIDEMYDLKTMLIAKLKDYAIYTHNVVINEIVNRKG